MGTMKNILTVRQGSEGGIHDPWCFTELDFTNLKGEVATAHLGLANFFIAPDGTRTSFYEGVENPLGNPSIMMAKHMGISGSCLSRLVSNYFSTYEADPMGCAADYI